MEQIIVYKNGTLEQAEGAVPREFPLKLTVNGREIVTLIASPHDLRFLVAGFLRLQGFEREPGRFPAYRRSLQSQSLQS